MAATSGSGGMRYHEVVVGLHDFRFSNNHFRFRAPGLFSRPDICYTY